MKQLIRNQTRFTGEALRNLIAADPVFNVLLEAASSSTFCGNLRYWASRGHLGMTGETPLEATYTVVNKDFFAA